jgi:hypothetical protein
MHAVSKTPHAKVHAESSKSENRMQNGDAIHTKKMHSGPLSPHAQSTNDSSGPGSLVMEYL